MYLLLDPQDYMKGGNNDIRGTRTIRRIHDS